jgi:PIN domain nuclease of toxin-antitoxin system
VSTHLDTHVALWMVAGERRRLRPVERELRKGPLFISSFVIVEMEFLREIGRVRAPVDEVLEILFDDHGVEEAKGEVREIGQHARALGWTRDPFDRLIVAHALALGCILLTADETIRAHCSRARWG